MDILYDLLEDQTTLTIEAVEKIVYEYHQAVVFLNLIKDNVNCKDPAKDVFELLDVKRMDRIITEKNINLYEFLDENEECQEIILDKITKRMIEIINGDE